MYVAARRDVGGGEAYHHVVLEYRITFGDGARGYLVTGLHLAATGEAAFDPGAQRQIRARNHYIVGVVQAYGLSGDGFFLDFDHG